MQDGKDGAVPVGCASFSMRTLRRFIYAIIPTILTAVIFVASRDLILAVASGWMINFWMLLRQCDG